MPCVRSRSTSLLPVPNRERARTHTKTHYTRARVTLLIPRAYWALPFMKELLFYPPLGILKALSAADLPLRMQSEMPTPVFMFPARNNPGCCLSRVSILFNRAA